MYSTAKIDAVAETRRAIVKFGVLYDFRNPSRSEWFQPWPELYSSAFEHMQEMEQVGFDSLSLCEQHGDPEGYNSGIAVTMTAAATRTRDAARLDRPYTQQLGQAIRNCLETRSCVTRLSLRDRLRESVVALRCEVTVRSSHA